MSHRTPFHSYGEITAPSRPLDRTRLTMMPRGDGARVAHQALNAVQRESPELMMLGVAMLFAALCSRTGEDPQELHAMASRVLRDQEAHKRDNDSLQSLRDFAGIRIKGERDVSIS